VKFLVDMPLSPQLAAWLRDRGHDAVHAGEVGLHRTPDADVMARAKFEGRTIITADLDYPHLLATAQATQPSLILFRDGNWSDAEIIARMDHVLASLVEADIAQSIIVVERDRVRRRPLPLGR
jgi:predicted nuclease of predicted toxin-antitoxin system